MAIIAQVLSSLAAGAAAGGVATAGVLFTGSGHILELASHDRNGWLALTLLGASFVATFGLAAVAGCFMEDGPAEARPLRNRRDGC